MADFSPQEEFLWTLTHILGEDPVRSREELKVGVNSFILQPPIYSVFRNL